MKYLTAIMLFLSGISASANQPINYIGCRSVDHSSNKTYVLEYNAASDRGTRWTLNGFAVTREHLGSVGQMGSQSYVVEIKLNATKRLSFIVNQRSPMESEMLVHGLVARDSCWDGCDNSIEGWEVVRNERATCRIQ